MANPRLREFVIPLEDIGRFAMLAANVGRGEEVVGVPSHVSDMIPDDTHVLHSYHEWRTRCIIILCSHESFDEVAPGVPVCRYTLCETWEKRAIGE